MPSVYSVNDSLRPSLVIYWIFGYMITKLYFNRKKNIVSHLPINDQLHQELGYSAIFTTPYRIEFYKVQNSMQELSIYLCITHITCTEIYAHKYICAYNLLFSLPLTISSLVDERYSPKFLQLLCLLFENHFFYFHHLILNDQFILRYNAPLN